MSEGWGCVQDEMEGHPGVAAEALPVKAADGTLHFIKPTKKERQASEAHKAKREEGQEAAAAKWTKPDKGRKGAQAVDKVDTAASDIQAQIISGRHEAAGERQRCVT